MLIYALYSANSYCNHSIYSIVQVHILCAPNVHLVYNAPHPNAHPVYTAQFTCTPTRSQSQLPQMELVQGKKKY